MDWYRQILTSLFNADLARMEAGGCVMPACCECIGGAHGIYGNCGTASFPGPDPCDLSLVCPAGKVFAGPNTSCSGLGSISGFPVGGGGSNGTNMCGNMSDYCNKEIITYPLCTCSSGSGLLDSNVKNVKMYLNTTDYICVPIVCEDCSGYELCGES